MVTRDRFPTLDTDHTDTTLAEDAAAARWCASHGPHADLLHRMLGLDGAPLTTHRKPTTRRPDRPRRDVTADTTMLPTGWARDPDYKARVEAEVLDRLARGGQVADVARAVGLSSRSVHRIRHNATTTEGADHAEDR